MNTALSGGSVVLGCTRSVVAEDDALTLFAGSETPIAMAMRSAIYGTEVPTPLPLIRTNHTAQWLKGSPEVYRVLVKHLSAKMQRSRDLGVVEDHVQTFLTRLIEKDTLAPFVLGGKTVRLSVLRVWAYQSASTELRRWGGDGSLRVSRGAKTAREVQAGGSWHPVQSASAAREVLWEDGSAKDLYDPSAPTPEESASRNSRVDEVRRALVRMGQPHLVPVVDGLLEGRSLTEIQETYGVTRDQITKVLQGIRA